MNVIENIPFHASELLFEVDHSTEEQTNWQAVFYFKDLKNIKSDDIPEAIASAAKSIFIMLYTKADCVGIPAISLRIIYNNNDKTDEKLSQLFTLSIMDELEDDSFFSMVEPFRIAMPVFPMTFLRERFISF